MKGTLLLLIMACLFTGFAYSQTNYEPFLNLSQYERSVRGEAEIEIKIIAEAGNQTIYLKAPVFLDYNLNDIRMFSLAPLKYLELFKKSVPDLTLLLHGYRTNGNNNSLDAGLMYAKTHAVSFEEGNEAESEINGYCENNLEICFHIPDFEELVKSGKKDLKYQLEISCASTSHTQKDVQGRVKFDGISITDGLTLDVNLSKPLPDLDDIPEGAFVNSKAQERFRLEYFKNLPAVDITALNQFLMTPAGKKTFEFSGMYAWKSNKYQVNYSGKITLDGTSVVDVNK